MLSLEHWSLWGLVFARCAGALALAPPLNWRPFPVSLRLAVAAVLALPLSLGLVSVPRLTSGPGYLAALLAELTVGLVVGLGLWLLTQALEAGGALGDLWLAGGDESEPGPVQTLYGLLVVVFFVQLNGLQWLLVFLRQSYELTPAGTGALTASGWPLWPGVMLVTALRTAAPLVLALLLATAIAGVVDRTLANGQLQAFLPAGRVVVLLLVLVAVAPLLGGLVLGELDHWAGLIVGTLRGLH